MRFVTTTTLFLIPLIPIVAFAQKRCEIDQALDPALYYCYSGTTGPVVVFEAGMRNTSSVWEQVIELVSHDTATLSYDRAGTGRSDKGPMPRTSKVIARELHNLLITKKIPGPYVLVGHSIGGWHARVFAHQYPDDVAGLIVIDSPHENFETDRLKLLSGSERESRKNTLRRSRSSLSETVQNEYKGLEITRQWLPDTLVSEHILVSVITAARHNWGTTTITNQLELLWQTQQLELTESLGGTLTLTHNSGHAVPTDDPEIVADAILKMVSILRQP